MRRHGLTGFLAQLLPSFLLIAACTSTAPQQHSKRKSSTPPPAVTTTLPAEALYQPAVTILSSAQIDARLQTMDDLIQAGNGDKARAVADTLNPVDLTPSQRDLLSLGYAQILLNTGEAELALKQLDKIQWKFLTPENKSKYWQARAFALSLSGQSLAGVKARIELDGFLKNPNELHENRAAILEALRIMPETKTASDIPGDILSGWQTLSQILSTPSQDLSLQAALQRWQDGHPGHPGNNYLQNKPPSQAATNYVIALLLPESGVYASAGKAIKAGFMAAYQQQVDHKPILQFYDTETASPDALYQQAINAGANLVIGPLDKDSIQKLANTSTLTIPVLALNVVPYLEKDKLYQFGLNPADETEQLAHRASLDNHQNALMLMPDNDAGRRNADLLTEAWLPEGGHIIDSQFYNLNSTDYASVIKAMFNIDESEARFQKLQQFFPDLIYKPRRRQDVDLLFLNAYSKEARSLNPQLHYYQTGDLPIYATANIYSGQINPIADQDLEGIVFCDIPWLFENSYSGPLGLGALQEVWSKFPATYVRLIAMGLDAYALTTQLDHLAESPYDGATGKLSLTYNKRIKRELTCAKFANGQPQAINNLTR
ncbi:MAG: penicillin-binding protein activator [Methylococcaceae bacterium]|jgi:hypothetical protein